MTELSRHILCAASRSSSSRSSSSVFRVLEVGAGDGKLAFHLQRLLGGHDDGRIEVLASDDKSWRIKPMAGGPTVHEMDCAAAVSHFRPNLVLCSWMPCGEDWTPGIRAVPEVESYVLIGEADAPDGCCGAGETWDEEAIGPGWTRHDISPCSTLQFSRHDFSELCGHGRTVSFQREADKRAPMNESTVSC